MNNASTAWSQALRFVNQAVTAGSISIQDAAHCIKQEAPELVLSELEAIKANK